MCYRQDLGLPGPGVAPCGFYLEASIHARCGLPEHLYTKIAASGESDEIEHWLGREFESPAEEAIEKAISGRRLSAADWVLLVRFFAAQDVRTPARLVENLERWSATLPGLIQETLRDSVRRLEAAGKGERELLARRAPEHEPIPFRLSIEKMPGGDGGILKGETVAGRGLWVWSIRHLLSTTLKVLHTHRWTILSPPRGITWFTSDDPVLKVNFNSLTDYGYGGGWGSLGTDLMMPLGPYHLLYTQVGKAVPRRGTEMSRDKADVIRRLIAEHAHRLVFALAPDPVIPELRPRTVNGEILRAETEQWRRWHREQTAAECNLMGWSTDSSQLG